MMARSLSSVGAAVIDGERGSVLAKRLIQLENDRHDIGEYIKEVYHAAKAAGIPAVHIRTYVKDRRQDQDELRAFREFQERLETALGPFMDTPLGAAAMRRVVEFPPKRRRGRPKKDPEAFRREVEEHRQRIEERYADRGEPPSDEPLGAA